MEMAIIQFHGVRDTSLIFVDDEFIIQSEFAFWGSR
jgi:hypothetical protein